MEHKQGFLNLTPFSNVSIDFKLSETHIDYSTLMSPTKAKNSLTYTISMETIQDLENSPKNQRHGHFNFLPLVQQLQQWEAKQDMCLDKQEGPTSLARINLLNQFSGQSEKSIAHSFLQLHECAFIGNSSAQISSETKVQQNSANGLLKPEILLSSIEENVSSFVGEQLQNIKISQVQKNVHNFLKTKPRVSQERQNLITCEKQQTPNIKRRSIRVTRSKSINTNDKVIMQQNKVNKSNSLFQTNSSSYVRCSKVLRSLSKQMINKNYEQANKNLEILQINNLEKNGFVKSDHRVYRNKRIHSAFNTNKVVQNSYTSEVARNRLRISPIRNKFSLKKIARKDADYISIMAVKINLSDRINLGEKPICRNKCTSHYEINKKMQKQQKKINKPKLTLKTEIDLQLSSLGLSRARAWHKNKQNVMKNVFNF